MKPGIHPDYNDVIFRDASNGQAFLGRSTMTSDKMMKWEDGNEYPVIALEISSTSHPFYTGTQRLLDTAGRVERFQQRYGLKKTDTLPGASVAESDDGPGAEAAEEEAPAASAEEAPAADDAPAAEEEKS